MSDLLGIIRGAASKYGLDPVTLHRFAEIESSLNPREVSKTGAKGLFQFTSGTAKRYGLSNPFDPAASADAAARLLRDNRSFLRRSLGREPKAGELYLAHQQGAAGAAALLANPNKTAVDALAPVYGGDRARAAQAIEVNGGSANDKAGEFAGRWMARFDGEKGPGATRVASADPIGSLINRLDQRDRGRRRDQIGDLINTLPPIYNNVLNGPGTSGLGLRPSIDPSQDGYGVMPLPASAPQAMAPPVEIEPGRYVAMTPEQYSAWISQNG